MATAAGHLEARRGLGSDVELARDVHDTVGSAMTAIHLQAQVALDSLEARPVAAAEALRLIASSTQRTLVELRSVLTGIPDAPGGPPGLRQLDALVASTTAGAVRAEIEVRGDLELVPPAHDEAAYRILQESLTNAIRHGEATEVQLRLSATPGLLTMAVNDNGRAQSDPQVRRLPGRGIRGMRRRATALGGSLTAQPHPDSGFEVRAWIPLPLGVSDDRRPRAV